MSLSSSFTLLNILLTASNKYTITIQLTNPTFNKQYHQSFQLTFNIVLSKNYSKIILSF